MRKSIEDRKAQIAAAEAETQDTRQRLENQKKLVAEVGISPQIQLIPSSEAPSVRRGRTEAELAA